MPGQPPVLDHLGCSGRVTLPTDPAGVTYARVPFGHRRGPTPGGSFLRQWTTAAAAQPRPSQPAAGAYLLLSGIVDRPCSATLARGIVDDLARGRHDRLAQLGDEATGCVVAADRIALFRGVASADQLFYRRAGARFEWSTDPADLLDDPITAVDRDAIWRACRGENVFVYRDLSFVRPGQLVTFDGTTLTRSWFDRLTPLDLPRRTSLRQYAEITYESLLRAARSYARAGRVGVLLSGGVDSSTVLMALADSGADVTAYHMGTEDPLADESSYAREACRRLGVPLVSVTTDPGGYFSTEWDFSHPFNHVWFRRISGIADRVRQDGVALLLTGLAGDILFGPLHYGAHSVLSRDLTWRERRHMLLGLACSRWELGRLLKSLAPSYSLTQDVVVASETAPSVEFLTPWPDAPPEAYDLDFLPQELALSLALWRPREILLGNPLGGRELRRLALRLPGAYKLIPFQGRLIDKPVLRLVASRRLPALIWRHYGRSWLSSPDETWCLHHPEAFADLIGAPDAELVKLGVVDPSRLTTVLGEPAALRRNTEALVSSAMTELFLRSLRRRAPEPVGG